jgi:hypothetical protein
MEKHQTFIIHCNNDKLWNFQELISYLAKNQHQHISLKINPEAICLETLGIYRLLDNFKFKQVDIYTENQLEKHANYNIVIDYENTFLSEKLDISSTLHVWDQTKTFLNFYGRPTASRLGIASHLLNCHAKNSLIHFSFGNTDDELQLYELEKLLQYDLGSIKKVGNLIVDMPIKQGTTNGYNKTRYNFNDKLTQIYQHILIDIVAETHVLGNTFFVTEKITRPMWLKKPFIVFGSRDYLCYLRQLGFKTFQTPTLDFWSEDYDGYEGRERYIRILALIDKLAKKSKEELQELYRAMQPILDHNYNLLQTQSYNTTITKIT